LRIAYAGKPRVAPRAPWDGGFVWATAPSGEAWIATAVQPEGCDLFWPCIDSPLSEPKRVDLHITVPSNLAAPSNGRFMGTPDPGDGPLVAQLTIRQRLVIRVPRLAPVKPVVWREKRADRCTPLDGIAGAAFTGAGNVDLFFSDGRRLRAQLGDKCPAIDFYSGFYLQRAADGMICAKRDAIRSRSGDFCRIEAFRELTRKR